MNYYKIGAADRNFFYTSTGEEDSFTLVLKISLFEKIDTGALYRALEQTVKLFRVFKMRLVIKDEILYYADNDQPLPLFEEEGHLPRYLGTKDTNGYLYRISCHDKDIEISLFHGMADGLGIEYFLATLLDYYFMFTDSEYAAKNTVRIPDLFNLQDMEDPYAEFASEKEPEMAGSKTEVFNIPENTKGENNGHCRYFELTVKTSELLAAAKLNGATPLPFLTAAIAEAVSRVYGIGDKTLTALTPANLRTIYGVNVCRNFARSFTIPYTPEMSRLPFDECCKAMREIMKEATRPEIFGGILRRQVRLAEEMEDNSVPLLQRAAKLQSDYIKGSAYFFSYVLTYIGRSTMPEYIEERVAKRFTMSNNPPVCPWGVLGFSLHDQIHFIISQFTADTRLIDETIKIFAENGIHVTTSEHGEIKTDKLVLDKIEHIM